MAAAGMGVAGQSGSKMGARRASSPGFDLGFGAPGPAARPVISTLVAPGSK